MTEVGLLTAFLGGLLALLSPCSALLLPAFFAYSFTTRTRLLGRTLLFYLGLCATLVPLGAAGSQASRLFYGHRETLVTVGGWTVIALGVAQILGFGFGFARLQRAAGARRSGSALSVLSLGAVYGLAGFCAGPILGGILTVAAMDGDPVHGSVLLAVYALGMALPMFVLALLWDRFGLGRRRWLRGRVFRAGPLTLHTTTFAGGVLFVALGALFLAFDGTSALPSLLDVDTEFAWEERVSRWGGAVSDRALLLVLAGVAAAGAIAVLMRTPRRVRPDQHGAGDEAGEAGDEADESAGGVIAEVSGAGDAAPSRDPEGPRPGAPVRGSGESTAPSE